LRFEDRMLIAARRPSGREAAGLNKYLVRRYGMQHLSLYRV